MTSSPTPGATPASTSSERGTRIRSSEAMALPTPLRIVVVGQSVGFFVRPPSRSGGPANYAELLEHRLRVRGIEAQVTNSSRWFLLAHEAWMALEPLVLNHSPHVVITNFGMGECQPKMIPTDVLRWMFTWRQPGSVGSNLLRRVFLRIVNAFYTSISPRLIAHMPWLPHRVRPRRFAFVMRRLVETVHKERQALVVMLGANPAGPKLERLLPGTDARSVRYTAILEEIAERSPGDATVIDCRSLVLEHGIDEVMPDGIHFNERGHDLVAARLEWEVLDWLGRTGRIRQHQHA